MRHRKTFKACPNAYKLLPLPIAASTVNVENQRASAAVFIERFPHNPCHQPFIASLSALKTQRKDDKYSRMFNAIQKTTHLEKQSVDKPPQQLKRRPTAPTHYVGLPIVYTNNKAQERTRVSAAHVLPKPGDFNAWRKHSMATLVKADDPLDPNGFYKNNYPLLLRQVPRWDPKDAINENEYRAISVTPDMCQSYYDSLPLGKVASDPVLHDKLLTENRIIEFLRLNELNKKLDSLQVEDMYGLDVDVHRARSVED